MPRCEDVSHRPRLRSSPDVELCGTLIDQTEVPLGHVLTNHAAGKINSLGGTDAKQTRASL